MQHLQVLVFHLIEQYGYFGLFVVMTFGNIGAPIGSEVVMPVAGALVATGHLPSLWGTIVAAVAGELAGGSLGYAAGRYGGRPFVTRFGKYVRFHVDQLDRVDAFFAQYGTFAIFICRFIPVVRGIVAIPAGISRMNLAAFYIWTFLGSVIFCGGLALLGHAFGRNLTRVLPLFHKGGMLILITALLIGIGLAVYFTLNGKRKRT